jgi:hypothetical protein
MRRSMVPTDKPLDDQLRIVSRQPQVVSATQSEQVVRHRRMIDENGATSRVARRPALLRGVSGRCGSTQ